MRINAISSSYNANNCNTHFKGLIKDPSALSIITSMSEKDKLELKNIEKRLSKTKFWDMKISSIDNSFKDLKFNFINKHNSRSIITDGIYPYFQKGKIINFYSIIYGPENTSFNTIEKLSFKSEKRAKELYDEYHENALFARNRGYNITPVENIKMKEVELRMLEEASETTRGKRHITQINTEYQTKQTTGNNLLLKD